MTDVNLLPMQSRRKSSLILGPKILIGENRSGSSDLFPGRFRSAGRIRCEAGESLSVDDFPRRRPYLHALKGNR